MAVNNNNGQGSGNNPNNINPINRTTSTQSKNGKGIDLSPFIGLDGSVKQLDKKMDTFISKLDQLTNNIVTAINNQKTQQNNTFQQSNVSPQFGERTPDINDSKNSGTTDFNREILASIRKQADTTRLLMDSLIPNIESIKNSIVESINSNRVESVINENPEISSKLESSTLTAEQISVFETFSDSIKSSIQENFDTIIETQRDMLSAMRQYNITPTQAPVNINEAFNQSIDKNQLLETQKQLTDMFSQIPKQTSIVGGKTTSTEPQTRVIEKHVTYNNELKQNDQQLQQGFAGHKVSAISEKDNYVNVPNYIESLDLPPTVLDMTRSALLGEYTLNQTDQPDYVMRDTRVQEADIDAGVEVGGLNPRQTIPLLDSSTLSSMLASIDYNTPKQSKTTVIGNDAEFSQRSVIETFEDEDSGIYMPKIGNRQSKFTDFLNDPMENSINGADNKQLIKNGEISLLDELFGGKENKEDGEQIGKPSIIDILSPGSTLAVAQQTGLGLLLMNLAKQQADGMSKSETLLSGLFETNANSGKSLSSLSSLLMEDSKQRAADKALGNLGSTGDGSGLGGALSSLLSGGKGESLGDLLTKEAEGSSGDSGGGLGDLASTLMTSKGGFTAFKAMLGQGGSTTAATAGGASKGIMSAKIGGGLGSGLVMGALAGTAVVLGTKLATLAFRGDMDEQNLKSELAQRNKAMTEAVQIKKRTESYQNRLESRKQSLLKKAEDRNALDLINIKVEGDKADARSQKEYAQQLAKISQADLQNDKMKDEDLAKIDETLRKEAGTERINFLNQVQDVDNSMDDAGDDAKAGIYDNEPFWLTESELNLGKTHSYENLVKLQGIVKQKIAMAEKQFNKWGPQIQAKRALSALRTYQDKLNMKVRMIKQRDDRIAVYENQRKNIEAERERRAAEEKKREEAARRQAEEQGTATSGDAGEFNKDVENTPATELLNDLKDKLSPEEFEQLQQDLQSDDPEVKANAEKRIKELYSGFKVSPASPESADGGLQTDSAVTAPQQQVVETAENLSEQDKIEAEQRQKAEAEQRQKAEAEAARNEQIARDTQRMADSSERQAAAAEKTAVNSDKPPVRVTHVVPPSNNLTTGPITTTKV